MSDIFDLAASEEGGVPAADQGDGGDIFDMAARPVEAEKDELTTWERVKGNVGTVLKGGGHPALMLTNALVDAGKENPDGLQGAASRGLRKIAPTLGSAAASTAEALTRSLADPAKALGGPLSFVASPLRQKAVEAGTSLVLDRDLTEGEREGIKASVAGPKPPTSEIINKAGDTLGEAARKLDGIREGIDEEKPDDLKRKLWGNPDLLLDERWWAETGIDTASSLIPTIVAGLYAGPGAAGVVGGSQEGSALYRELVDEGIDEEKARIASTAYGTVSGMLNAIGAETVLGRKGLEALAGKGVLKRLARRGFSGLVEGSTEYAEEPAQAVAQAIAEGKGMKEVLAAGREALKNIDVIPTSMLMGGAMHTDNAYGTEREDVDLLEDETAGEKQPTYQHQDHTIQAERSELAALHNKLRVGEELTEEEAARLHEIQGTEEVPMGEPEPAPIPEVGPTLDAPVVRPGLEAAPERPALPEPTQINAPGAIQLGGPQSVDPRSPVDEVQMGLEPGAGETAETDPISLLEQHPSVQEVAETKRSLAGLLSLIQDAKEEGLSFSKFTKQLRSNPMEHGFITDKGKTDQLGITAALRKAGLGSLRELFDAPTDTVAASAGENAQRDIVTPVAETEVDIVPLAEEQNLPDIEALEAEVGEGQVELTPDQQEFIAGKVKELGSVEEVEAFYAGKDKAASFAKEKAQELFADQEPDKKETVEESAASEKQPEVAPEPVKKQEPALPSVETATESSGQEGQAAPASELVVTKPKRNKAEERWEFEVDGEKYYAFRNPAGAGLAGWYLGRASAVDSNPNAHAQNASKDTGFVYVAETKADAIEEAKRWEQERRTSSLPEADSLQRVAPSPPGKTEQAPADLAQLETELKDARWAVQNAETMDERKDAGGEVKRLQEQISALKGEERQPAEALMSVAEETAAEQPQAQEAPRKKERALVARLKERLLKELPDKEALVANVHEVDPPSAALDNIAKAIKHLFGIDVVFVKGLTEAGADGIFLRGLARNTIFVNAGDGISVHKVMGHELLHALEAKNPIMYRQFKGVLLRFMKNTGRYQRRLNELRGKRGLGEKNYSYAMDELLADFVGDQLLDPSFLHQLAEHSPQKADVIRYVATQFHDIISKVVDYFRGGAKTAAYVKDLETARDVLAQYLGLMSDPDMDTQQDAAGEGEAKLKVNEPVGGSIEVAPNPREEASAPLTEAFASLNYDKKLAVTRRVGYPVIKDVFNRFGLKLGRDFSLNIVPGGFDGEANPSIEVRVHNKAVDFDSLANAIYTAGYVLRQNSVVLFDENDQQNGSQTYFVLVQPAEKLSDREISEVYQKVTGAFPAAEGFSTRDGNLLFGNFTEMSDEEFYSGIEAALADDPRSFTTDEKTFRSELTFTEEPPNASSEAKQEQQEELPGRGQGSLDSARARAQESLEEALRAAGAKLSPARSADEGVHRPARTGSAGAVGGLPTRGDGRVELVHWSRVAGLDTLDPAHHGTGIPGAESKRKQNDPANYVDRLYFGVQAGGSPYSKEPTLGPHRYTSSLDPSEIYDLASDPEGLRAKSTDWGQFSPTLYEKNIRDAGYAGFFFNHPQLGTVVASFQKVTPESYEDEAKFSLSDKEMTEAFEGMGYNVSANGDISNPDGQNIGSLDSLSPWRRWQALAMTKVVGRLDGIIDGMRKLPQRKEYLKRRWLALGKLDALEKHARNIFDTLRKASPEQAKDVFQFLTARDADPSMLPDEFRDFTVEIKHSIIDIGRKLVAKGMMQQAALDKHEGEYLPRVYLKHLLGEDVLSTLVSGSGKGLNLEYLKRRKDIPKAIRKFVLGEIEDPAFLASRAHALPMRDMVLHDFMEAIADNKSWVLPKVLVDWAHNKRAQRRHGNLSYIQNADGTYDITITERRKVETRLDKVKPAALSQMIDSEVAKLILANKGKPVVVNSQGKHRVSPWRDLGNTKWRRNKDGSYSVRFKERVTSARSLRSVAEADLGQHLTEHQQQVVLGGKGRLEGGQRMTPLHMLKEAQRLETMATAMPAEDAPITRQLAERMRQEALQVIEAIKQEHGIDLENPESMPKEWRQIPNTKRYGTLRGAIVRREIYDDLVGNINFAIGERNVAEKWLMDGGYLSRFHGLWKWKNTALNTTGQVRNWISNAMLIHLSGVPMLKIPGYYTRAIKEILAAHKGEAPENHEHWAVAQKYGINKASFSSTEMGRIETEFVDTLGRIESGESALKSSWRKLHLFASQLYNKSGDIYQFGEAVGKTVIIMHSMEKGMTEEQAAEKSHKWLFDYSLTTGSIKTLRSGIIGSPFLTFTAKVLPRMAEVATTAPWRLIPYIAAMKGMAAMVAEMFDVDDDDLEKLKKAMPKWLAERGHSYFLPYKDSAGRWQIVDLGYLFPWTAWTEAARAAGRGDVTAAMQPFAIGGPVPDLITAIKTGVDPFSKQQIVPPEATEPEEKAAAWVSYAYNFLAPPFLTSHGPLKRSWQAVGGTVDKFGDPKTTSTQALLRWMGINIYSHHPEVSRAYNLMAMRNELEEVVWSYKKQLADRNLSDAERDKIAREATEKTQKLTAKMLEYAGDSEIHESLATAYENL